MLRNPNAASDECRNVVTSGRVKSSLVSAKPVIRYAVLHATAASTAPIDGQSKMRVLEVQTPRVPTDTQRVKVEGAGLVLHARSSVPLSVRLPPSGRLLFNRVSFVTQTGCTWEDAKRHTPRGPSLVVPEQ